MVESFKWGELNMRMWMLNPKIMCRQHILGEHNEIHKHLPSLLKGINIDGRYKDKPQIQLRSIFDRHFELSQYMNHKSLLPYNDYLLIRNYSKYFNVKVDLRYNFWDLWLRCPKCRKQMSKCPKISREYAN